MFIHKVCTFQREKWLFLIDMVSAFQRVFREKSGCLYTWCLRFREFSERKAAVAGRGSTAEERDRGVEARQRS